MAISKSTATKKTTTTSKTTKTTRKKTTTPNKNKSSTTKTTKPRKNGKLNTSQETKENRCITDYFPVISRRRIALAKAEDEYRKCILSSIESNKDPIENLIITEFEGKGKGVIAGNLIVKGSFVCEYAGDLINLDEAKVSVSCPCLI